MSEVSLGSDEEEDSIVPIKRRESKLDWFKMPKFYLFGVCYMCVRIYTNLFGTLLPFYLTDVLGMGSVNEDEISFNLALVPMIAYLSSVGVSTQLNKFYQIFGRKKALFVGTAICIVCLVVMAFLNKDNNWIIYIVALFVGTFKFTQALLSLWCCRLGLTLFLTWWVQRVRLEHLSLVFTVSWISFHAES
jgi:Na+/melibiose symporter-like transporter